MITYTDATMLEHDLVAYRAAGFVVMDRAIKHRPGPRTGFVSFCPEYAEFRLTEAFRRSR
ncbi:MAG TPA: hypothetical protein VKX16_10685 [Chloroflexota bacterium]|nr:hypothetical protein [Chloroflexota bacterium]